MADASITVTKDGPYVVTGDVPVTIQVITPNDDGESWEWSAGRVLPAEATYELCRCGKSKKKPFCDNSHARVGFNGTETASRASYRRQAGVIDGPALALQDAEKLCAFARFCDGSGGVWSLVEADDDPDVQELVTHQATHCPSGRLVLRDKARRMDIEPELAPPSIGIVEDPAMDISGPLWLRGGIPVTSADGRQYEVRNRVTLCRCGASSNKPFCDGSHASIKFRDGLQAS